MRRKDREVQNASEIRKILSNCKTCHIAMSDGGTPYIVPMSYGFEISENTLTLYFHSAFNGRKIDILKRSGSVCFEISHEGEYILSENPCRCGICYSSVIGNGRAVFIEDGTEKCLALNKMFKHQTGRDINFTHSQAKNVCVFKIISDDFTAKTRKAPNK